MVDNRTDNALPISPGQAAGVEVVDTVAKAEMMAGAFDHVLSVRLEGPGP